MISLGRTLSELRWQNRAARNRTIRRSKTLAPGRDRTKKFPAEAPFQKVTVGLALTIAVEKLMRVASFEARGYMDSLAQIG